MNAKSAPVSRLVVYRVKKGKEADFLPLLKQHAPTLAKLGLVTDAGVQTWRAKDIRTGQVAFVELFHWKDADAPEVGHQSPELMKVWEPMTPLLDGLELSDLEPITP